MWKIPPKWPKMSETKSPPLGNFIKSLGEAVILGQMALKQACTNSFLGALQRKIKASTVSLGSLAIGNML